MFMKEIQIFDFNWVQLKDQPLEQSILVSRHWFNLQRWDHVLAKQVRVGWGYGRKSISDKSDYNQIFFLLFIECAQCVGFGNTGLLWVLFFVFDTQSLFYMRKIKSQMKFIYSYWICGF